MLKKTAIALSMSILVACSSAMLSDIFLPYDQQMRAARFSLQSSNLVLAAKNIKDEDQGSSSYYLKRLERGRVSYLQGDYQQSLEAFDEVAEHQAWLQRQPEYRFSAGLHQLSTLVTNDNLIPYHIPVYEQVLLHLYSAWAYLPTSLESALVEVRKANQIQAAAADEQAVNLEEQLREQQKAWTELQSQYAKYQRESELGEGAQLAYSHALAAALYLADGKDNDAYISYRKALALAPANQSLQREVARLGAQLAMSDYQEYSQAPPQPLAKDEALLLVFYEQGLVSARREFGFTLPLYRDGRWNYYSVALPVMGGSAQLALPFELKLGATSTQAEPISYVDSLSYFDLKSQLPFMLLRQAARVVTKEQVRREVTDKNDDYWLNAAVNLYNIASERADTRSWQTLPAVVQFAVMPVKNGAQHIELVGVTEKQVELNAKAGSINILWLSDLVAEPRLYSFY